MVGRNYYQENTIQSIRLDPLIIWIIASVWLISLFEIDLQECSSPDSIVIYIFIPSLCCLCACTHSERIQECIVRSSDTYT